MCSPWQCRRVSCLLPRGAWPSEGDGPGILSSSWQSPAVARKPGSLGLDACSRQRTLPRPEAFPCGCRCSDRGPASCRGRWLSAGATRSDQAPSHPQVRYRREQLCARQPPHFPLLEDLMRDGSHGAALLAVVHYYCPGQLKLDGECGPRLRGHPLVSATKQAGVTPRPRHPLGQHVDA